MKRLNWYLGGFSFVLLLYSLFSFSLTDPNLVLTSWAPYWSFQQWMWQSFFQNPILLTHAYLGLIIMLFAFYGAIIFRIKKIEEKSSKNIKKIQKNPWKIVVCFLLITAPLLFSYNALSHDVFNYIFNAKIVTQFKANPHTKVALDYSYDNWTRFMHNTHTPAPYGYGWTAISLAPYLLGLGKFLPTWLLFRAFEVLGIVLLFWILRKLHQEIYKKEMPLSSAALLFLNPLFLIEIIGNMHNDLWMMVPALAAITLIIKKTKWPKILLAVSLLAISISTKMATLVLLPFLIIMIFKPRLKWLNKYFSNENLVLLASITMFIPLFTARSQQFLPWYLIWSLVWLPLFSKKIKAPANWWQILLIGFSFSGLARYAPWLIAGGFGEQVLTQQKIILWGFPLGFLISYLLAEKLLQLFKKNPLQ